MGAKAIDYGLYAVVLVSKTSKPVFFEKVGQDR